MNHSLLIKTTVVSGLLVFGLVAFAQDRNDRDRDRDEDRYHQLNRDEDSWKQRLFQRVREDLDHVQAATPTLSSDEYRLVTTKRDLEELQGKLETRRFDQPQLDRVIAGVEKVLSNNRLSQRDHDLLTDDLRRMRDYREHHDAYGPRG